MSHLSTSLLYIIAGICLISSAYHLLIWRQLRDEWMHFTFGLLCLFGMSYILGSAHVYQADTVEASIPGVKWQAAMVFIFKALAVWFFAFYTNLRSYTFPTIFSIVCGLIFTLNIFAPFSIWYTNVSGIETIALPWGEHIFVPQYTASIWLPFSYLMVFLWISFGCIGLVRQYKRGERKKAILLAVSLLIYVVSISLDAVQDLAQTHYLYLGDYGFLGVILIMSQALSLRFRERTVELANANQNLQEENTRRKKTEKELEYRNILLSTQSESSPDGILVVDTEGNWSSFNQRFIDMWEIPPEIVDAHSDRASLQFIQEKLFDPDEFLERVQYLYKHPNEKSQGEITLTNGRIFERYSAPTVGPDGQTYGRIWFFRDISEQRTLELQLIQAQKMEAVGQLAGGVAHDFNNLLQAIVGYGELALIDTKSPDNINKYLNEVMKAADRGKILVRQLMAFSRTQLLKLESLDLSRVIDNLANMIRRVMGENIVLSVHSIPNLQLIRGDKGQIEQVLMNLCVNACDAMPRGGEIVIQTDNVEFNEEYCKIHSWATPGQYVMMKISDNGCGMPENIQKHIFDPFYTTKDEGEGTGLGLSTVYGILRQHKGIIKVSSEVGKGTTFHIYIPTVEHPVAMQDEDKKRRSDARLEMAEDDISLDGSETILLAEDNTSVRNVVTDLLKSAGYRVLAAKDGEETLDLLNKHADEIALALLDIVMPKISGYDIYETMQKTCAHIPILFASGYSAKGTRKHFIISDKLQFIQKPYHMEDLLQKLRNMIDA